LFVPRNGVKTALCLLCVDDCSQLLDLQRKTVATDANLLFFKGSGPILFDDEVLKMGSVESSQNNCLEH
jgi:hypothetical protein